jgi:hypothetical protein
LVAHLVFEMLMAFLPSERLRQVHIVANENLVESRLSSSTSSTASRRSKTRLSHSVFRSSPRSRGLHPTSRSGST